MATIKKACKGGLYPKASSVSSRLGSPSKKMKSGGSLGMKSVKAGYDKNPGVTRADIIVAAKGKAKRGAKIKKAQAGDRLLKSVDRRLGGKKDVFISDDGKYRTKYKYRSDSDTTPSRVMNRRTLKGFLTGAPRGIAQTKPTMKRGGTMKKCKYGCK